ncbi:bile acid:sodium symporter family protein [Ferviditalea candida]|uniref:Bile acid:sodium symporter family protein n=1 Tax=Ferviditalea candida TaxID=3108399 RepID=A0ABU5ZKJ2_9BACL|nr:bile acid:sodium symporter family protein [Paenibacillaceae bacterium T2]
MLQKLNQRLEKLMPFITPFSVVAGVLLGDVLSPYAFLVPWLFAFMTFSGSLSTGFREFREVVSHPLPIFAVLIILHVLMPLLAWGAASSLFHGDAYTITGLVLGMVIPTGITSFIWVSIYKGSIPLSLSIILIDTLLSPFVVPSSLLLLVGTHVHIDVLNIMKGLLWMIALPSLAGMMLNQLTRGGIKQSLGAKLAPFSKIAVGVVVGINGAVVAPYLTHITGKLISIALLVVIMAAVGYALGWGISRLLKWERDISVSMMFNGGMRNISGGAVLAVAYFSPPAAIPVVIGMLFQQMLASFFGALADKYYSRRAGLRRKPVAVDRKQVIRS